MKRETYFNLRKESFFTADSANKDFFNGFHPELSAKLPAINEIILKDLNIDHDFKNIVLFVPSLYTNWFLDKDKQIISSHCTDIVDIRHRLHFLGVKYKNDISLLDDRYRQHNSVKIIIHNGIAYNFPRNNDPLYTSGYDATTPIDYNDDDDYVVTIEGKELLFFGVAKHILQNYLAKRFDL